MGIAVEQLTYNPGIDDPKEVIMSRVSNELDKIPEIYGARLLVATAPSTDMVGKLGLIHATVKNKDEGRWQCKTALIIKLGTTAFKNDPRYPAYVWPGGPDDDTPGPKPTVGDWVFFRVSDGWEIGIGGISCRILWDSDVVGRVLDAEAIY